MDRFSTSFPLSSEPPLHGGLTQHAFGTDISIPQRTPVRLPNVCPPELYLCYSSGLSFLCSPSTRVPDVFGLNREIENA